MFILKVMKKKSVFIDGSSGTTGLQVVSRLSQRSDISLIFLPDKEKKLEEKRLQAMQEADLTILCLPDLAAIRAVELVKETDVRIIDASSAHRTAPGWVYGFPELCQEQIKKIAKARFVSNPGCYASGFIALSRPLVDSGFISPDLCLISPAVSGYSGGGKNMIKSIRNGDLPTHFDYGLELDHKHIPEMIMQTGLQTPPLFMPSVGLFEQGMLVRLAIPKSHFSKDVSIKDIFELYKKTYSGHPLIKVCEREFELMSKNSSRLSADGLAGQDGLEIYCFNNPKTEQFLLISRLDNLGKGAAGACVQNLNIMLGCDQYLSLNWQ